MYLVVNITKIYLVILKVADDNIKGKYYEGSIII